MQTEITRTEQEARRLHVSAWVVLAGGLLLAATPAFAQEGVLFQNLVKGMGLFGSDKDDIDYKQRAPLVVPPSSALPKPQEPGATRTAAWPDDPDVARRKADRDASRSPFASTEVYREMLTADGVRVLNPTVGRLERYAQAFGLPINNAAATAYGDIAAELLTVTATP